jgi:chitinase
MDLLWRNDVPPGKVILGLGFYGRAFQLQDTSCTSVGCPFAGASAKGPCTGEGGILGYFEIMDILNDKTQTIDVIYDEEAAVNYFTYSKYHWISYDNATSFKAKVDWANTVG